MISHAEREFVQQLRAARREAGLSQQDVADRMVVARSRIATIESCRMSPCLNTLMRYAEAVGARVALVRADGDTVERLGRAEQFIRLAQHELIASVGLSESRSLRSV